MVSNDVYVYVEGGVVHDVVAPGGVTVHVIDLDTEGLDPDAGDKLCTCDAADCEHWHGTYGHEENQTAITFEDGRVSA